MDNWKLENGMLKRLQGKMAQKEDGDRVRGEIKNAKEWEENLKDEGSCEARNVCYSINEMKNNYFFIY